MGGCAIKKVKNGTSKNEALKIRGIKGKIDFNKTIKSLSHLDRKFYCEFDEFSANIIPNQIIKATLKILIRSKINSELKKSLKRKILSLSEINDIELCLCSSNILSNDNPIPNSL